MSEEITEQEAERMLRQFSESKSNVHSFLTNVVKGKDTTKTGNLTADELGMPKIPVRTMKELSLFSKEVASEDEWAEYFKSLSEIQTSTSLSKEGLLLKLSVTQKKELADMTPKTRKVNKGWFKKKEEPQEVS